MRYYFHVQKSRQKKSPPGSTGQSFEDLDTAMRCQNDYVKGMSCATLELRYPMQPIPV